MKMKMILALLYLVMVLSAAEEEEKNLAAVVGGNITLPDPLMEMGFLYYGRTYEEIKLIAKVENGNVTIVEESYGNKVHGNPGLTITDLQRNDSGVYIICSTKGDVFNSSYNVTVYEPVETPAGNRTDSGNHEGTSTTNRILIVVFIIIMAVVLLGGCGFFYRDKIWKIIRKTTGREGVV